MSNHPGWLAVVEFLKKQNEPSRETSKFVVVGMAEGKPRATAVELHRVEAGAGEYLRDGVARLRQRDDVYYAHAYAAFRLWCHHDKGGVWLPYPPDGKEAEG